MLVHSIQLFWSKVSFRVLEEISWHIVQNLAHEFSNFLGLILLERTLCVVTAAHDEDDGKRFRESVHTLLVVVEERLDDAFIEGDWIVRLLMWRLDASFGATGTHSVLIFVFSVLAQNTKEGVEAECFVDGDEAAIGGFWDIAISVSDGHLRVDTDEGVGSIEVGGGDNGVDV